MQERLSYNELLTAYNSRAEKYNALIDTSPDGIMLLTALRNEQGQIVDFLIEQCNRAGAILGRFPPDAQLQSLLTILPHLKDSEQFAMHQKVVDTAEPFVFETTFREEDGSEYGWFIVSLMKVEDGVLSRFINISDKKENEVKLQQQAVFYNGILDASINGVFACDTVRNETGEIIDFIFTKVNKAFTEMTRRLPEDVEGKSFISIFPDAKSWGTFDLYCQVVNTGVAVRKEVQATTGSGDWYDLSIGKITENSLAVTFTNISQRMNAFAEVQEQKNLLDNILQNSPSGISVTEVIRNQAGEITDAKLIMVNEITEHFSNIPRSIALQKTLGEIDPNILQSGLFKMAANTLLTGKPFRTQYFYEPTGKWLELGVSKMDGNRLVNIYSDITETKQAQLQQEKLMDELRRTNTNLEEFTYAASHDLKEPIRKIRIFADRLKDKHSTAMDDEGQKILDRLIVSANRMRLLVDDLLEYSHVSLYETETEMVDLNDKLKKVLEDLEMASEEKSALIYIEDLPTVKGYKRQLQQLFQNLVSNSLKYSRVGEPPVIRLTSAIVKGHTIEQTVTDAESQKDFYHISITDNGIGFKQKNADKIFRVFQRLHNRTEYNGTGVGLSIVKKVVENHHGYITALGKPGIGAVFNVYLPVV